MGIEVHDAYPEESGTGPTSVVSSNEVDTSLKLDSRLEEYTVSFPTLGRTTCEFSELSHAYRTEAVEEEGRRYFADAETDQPQRTTHVHWSSELL
jgi:hypothetical protein